METARAGSSYFQGELDFYYEMEYDEEDRVIRQRNYDGDGTLEETAVTEYGIDGTNGPPGLLL